MESGQRGVEVVVLDPLPLFSQGVLAALGRGKALESADGLATWVAGASPAVVLLTLHDEDSWQLLRSVATHAGLCVVAVLPSSSVTSAASALRAGAAHVLPRDADAAALRRVVDEAADGLVCLPIAVLRAAIVALYVPGNGAAPSDEELRWLRALAASVSVAELADSAGYSERAMYRRLRELYGRLGAKGRTQALILARDQGWL